MSVRGTSFIISQIPTGKYIRNEWVQNLEGCSLIVYSEVLDTYNYSPNSGLKIFVIKLVPLPNLSSCGSWVITQRHICAEVFALKTALTQV